MNMEDLSLKPYYDADLTIFRSQRGGFCLMLGPG